MLKIITSMLSLLLFLFLSKNFWLHTIFMFMILTTMTTPFITSQMLAPSALSNMYMLDSLSSPLITLSIWISALMMMASYKELVNKNKPKTLIMYTVILCTILLVAFMAYKTIMFYIFFEASLIPTMLLILGWGYQPERLQASMYFIMYTVMASLPLLMSILYIRLLPNNMLFTTMQWKSMNMAQTMHVIWWTLTIIAFVTKMPLYMFHLWLPKAHVEAPVAGSMILAGILLKLGSYGFLRLSSVMMKMNKLISSPMMTLSLSGAVMTSMICLRQTDLKSLIAYSSVGHMSLLMSGMMSMSSWGWNAALTMMLAHGLCSSSLFALSNMLYESTQTRSIFMTKGMMTIFPTMTMWWFLNCAMNMAAPPTSNLLSEMFLIMGAMSFSSWTTILLMSIVFLAAAYSLHLYATSQHGPMALFTLPMNLLMQRNYYTISMHLVPSTILILKSDMIMTWA